MIQPRLRLGGPLQARDATWLLVPASALVAARIPSGFLALLALPAVVVAVQGVRRRAAWPSALRWAVVLGLACSFLALAITSPMGLASPQYSFLVMVAVALVCLSVFNGNRTLAASHRLIDGIHLGLLFSWALSVMEAVTGFKMITLLYPNGNTAAAVAKNRFYVSAMFPNYNDYSVAMTYLCLLTFAGMLFHRRVGALRGLGRWLVLLSATFFIVHMGSRGCLGALVIGYAIIALCSVRQLHPRAIGPRLVFLGLAVGAVGIAALATSSYVDDHSTASRGRIASAIFSMMGGDPVHGLLGWGGYVNYIKAAQAIYGSTLMDPHNVLLELITWYGLPTLLVYLPCWWFVVRRGLLRPRAAWSWRSVSVITIAALMPLIGVVCSSTLRYHLFWLWLVAALAEIQQWHGGPAPTGTGTAVGGAHPAQEGQRPIATSSSINPV